MQKRRAKEKPSLVVVAFKAPSYRYKNNRIRPYLKNYLVPPPKTPLNPLNSWLIKK